MQNTFDSSQITLEPISSSSLREVIRYWDSHAKDLDKFAVKEAVGRNPLARYIAFNTNPDPVRRVLSSVLTRWQCFGVLETPYTDLDFLDHYAEFYARSFIQTSPLCARLHFFSCDGDLNDDISEIDANTLCTALRRGLEWKTRGNEFAHYHYRGYCVLRPTNSFVVGRTAIQFDSRSAADIPSPVKELITDNEEGGRPCLNTSISCSATLLTTHLSVPNTVEFIQQDPNLGACATASVWVASRILAERFNLNKFAYPTITRQASRLGSNDQQLNQNIENSAASEGLAPSQICAALAETGAYPQIIGTKPGKTRHVHSMRLKQELYTLVESGIPVLMLVTDDNNVGHAVVAVGHNLPRIDVDAVLPSALECLPGTVEEISSRHILLSSCISVFYTHDDRYGPYNRVTFDSVEESLEEQINALDPTSPNSEDAVESPPNLVPVSVGGRDSEPHNLVQLIAPIPPSIRQNSLDSLTHLLSHFDMYYKQVLEHSLNELAGPDTAFVWRSLLVEKSHFKRSIVYRNYNRDLIEWYAQLRLPKYVWLFEVTVVPRQSVNSLFSPVFEHKIHGEYLFDPTTPRDEPLCLTARFMGFGRDYTRGSMNEPLSAIMLSERESNVGLYEDENSQEAVPFTYRCYTPPPYDKTGIDTNSSGLN